MQDRQPRQQIVRFLGYIGVVFLLGAAAVLIFIAII